jgi:flagellar basal-body rod protein FlgB
MDAITSLTLARALDGLHQRQIATAYNIANGGTPSFRPLTVRFEEQLRAAARAGPAALARVTAQTVQGPARGEQRLDLEVATASETALRYSALVEVAGRRMAIDRAIVSGGR